MHELGPDGRVLYITAKSGARLPFRVISGHGGSSLQCPLCPRKRTFCDPVPMSASLIGRLGSSTFRPSAAAVSMSLTGSCFSSESALGPLYGVFLVKKFMQSGTSFFIRQFLCSI